MKEIQTSEYVQYKSGFIDGKFQVIKLVKLGKTIDLNQDEDFIESWYTYGFKDGIEYFSNLAMNNKLDLGNINTKKAIKDCFTKKVIDVNQKEGKNTPISKFRL